MRLKREILNLYSLFLVLVAVSMVSCSKERFKMFDDLDCVTTEELVVIDVPITEIPGRGGDLKLDPSVYTEVTYWKGSVKIDTKKEPITDFEVSSFDVPEGTVVKRVADEILLSVPANKTNAERPVVIQVTAKGVTKKFAYLQRKLRVSVNVEVQ
ncbi:hypothetical protein [Porphyromonas levii]|uniref:hypothetical protein n=1 Tax=Porphyromonas levii TaxID=28114 RepID=UPI001B8D2B82|nr:hypothetical protein [Porphyromonas levii]MBR8760432.1 hypothetical protein [Porphyromonas levii]